MPPSAQSEGRAPTAVCEQGIAHAERLEDSVARKVVECLSADAPHNLGEQHEIQVTVDKPLARRRFRNLVGRARDSHGLPLEDILQRQVGAQPRHVGQQLLNGNRAFVVAGKLRDMGHDGGRGAEVAPPPGGP